MPWNGSGGITWTYNWTSDAAANIKILASRQDGQWSDAKTVIENTICRDGQNSPSANIAWGGYKITGLGTATARTDAASLGVVQDGTGTYIGTDTGTAGAYAVALSPAITAYTTGQRFIFKAANANNAAPTINFNAVSAKTITDAEGGALPAGAIKANSVAELLYDGTNFRLIAGGQKVASPVSKIKLYFYGQL